MNDLKVLGYIIIAYGLVFVISSLIIRLSSNRLKSKGLGVDGKIVGYTSQKYWQFNKERAVELGLSNFSTSALGGLKRVTRVSSNTFHPIYSYTVNGVVYTKAMLYSASKNFIKVGKDVVVRYNPDNPFDSIVSNNRGYKILYIILFVLGILIITAGVIVVILSLNM